MTAKNPDLWTGFTEADARALLDYVVDLAERLRLRDWTFSIDRFPLADEDDAYAATTITFGQRRATIALCRDWPNLDAQKKRRVIAHELLHCHFDGPLRHVERVLPVLVGKPASTPIIDKVHEDTELAVDTIAEAFAEHLPEVPA